MSTLHVESRLGDAQRRARIYDGDVFVYAPTPHSIELTKFAQELCQQAFEPHDPPKAQHGMQVEDFVAVLAKLKPSFIHHPRSKELLCGLLRDLKCEAEATYFDVPRLRTMAHGDYLKAGLAYAFHPHRDTWFSAPPCQINWWIPVYAISRENTIAFHPRYWCKAVRNSSRDYDYERWNKESRFAAAQQIKVETRRQPQAEESLDLDSEVRVVCEPGSIVLFSAAQMHSTVPNTSGVTRFSIDFRTVQIDDVIGRSGAPNLDSACTGTTLRDFLRASDLERMPEEVAMTYDHHVAETPASISVAYDVVAESRPEAVSR